MYVCMHLFMLTVMFHFCLSHGTTLLPRMSRVDSCMFLLESFSLVFLFHNLKMFLLIIYNSLPLCAVFKSSNTSLNNYTIYCLN